MLMPAAASPAYPATHAILAGSRHGTVASQV
jgi:hypothetical protein